MTLLVVILSITNIAIGYGLAIYLGHVHGAPKTVRAAREQQAKEETPVEEPLPEPIDVAPPTVSYEPAVEAVAPEPVVMTPVVAAPEPVAAAVETQQPAPVAAPAVAAAEPVTEEAVLNQIDEARAELHETPAPATMAEALAAEPSSAPAEPATEADATGKPVSKEALLESINAFQAQLKKQQELAKLHAVASK